MSFTTDIKENIALVQTAHCCERAEAYAMLINAAKLTGSEIKLVSESASTVKHFSALIDKLCEVAVEITTNGAGYVATIDEESAMQVLTFFYIDAGAPARLSRANLENECCVAAFVRGAFLACGNACNPQKSYRIEFVTRHKQLASDFATLLSEEGLAPTMHLRQSKVVLYYKSSERIFDLLTYMGASKNAFDLINTRIEKQFKNKANRMANSDAANIQRMVNAALSQDAAIEKLMDSRELSALPEEMQKIAMLRHENSVSSLTELAQLSGIARSKIDRSLRKLVALAEDCGTCEEK